MSGKIKYWISTARPHTLTLGLSCAGMGNIAAANNGSFHVSIAVFSLLTAVLLQILSNFANDYGDYKHGADNSERKGPKRALQKGFISLNQLKSALILLSLLSLISGVILLIFAFPKIKLSGLIILFAFGVAAIWAAYAYTASKKPYGYRGLGDIFVFIFFGIFAVGATFFLHSGTFCWIVLLPACSIGFLSTAVLNLNNLRDIDTDKKTGKITIAVRLGAKKTVTYHYFLLAFAFLSMSLYNFIILENKIFLIQLLPFLLLLPSIRKFENLYMELKKLSLIIIIIVIFQTLNLIF